MKSLKPLIIIPTYNEVENIDTLLSAIFAVVKDIHVLFVDDNSQDGTREKIYRAQKKYSDQIYLIEREGKLGLGTAYIAGFRWALKKDYQTIIEMDADLSHDPIYLTDMFGKLENYDGVFGSLEYAANNVVVKYYFPVGLIGNQVNCGFEFGTFSIQHGAKLI